MVIRMIKCHVKLLHLRQYSPLCTNSGEQAKCGKTSPCTETVHVVIGGYRCILHTQQPPCQTLWLYCILWSWDLVHKVAPLKISNESDTEASSSKTTQNCPVWFCAEEKTWQHIQCSKHTNATTNIPFQGYTGALKRGHEWQRSIWYWKWSGTGILPFY